jgi:hypothetical protein
LSSKNKDPILEEPITEVHDYDEEEGVLNVRTLQEALKTSAQQHMAEACKQLRTKSNQSKQMMKVKTNKIRLTSASDIAPSGPRLPKYLEEGEQLRQQ